jgi:hypothetical protein
MLELDGFVVDNQHLDNVIELGSNLSISHVHCDMINMLKIFTYIEEYLNTHLTWQHLGTCWNAFNPD